MAVNLLKAICFSHLKHYPIKYSSTYSLKYGLLKRWVKFGLWVFFRDIEVHGTRYIPKNVPVLFAVNHPNTLIDALLTCCYSPLQPWFLARGDVFANHGLAKIFSLIRMLPVYRERDGRGQLKENTGIFTTCSNILGNGGSLVMFPEGSHNREWRIRDMRKGLARIAHEAYDHGREIYIVPVGLCYSDPVNSFTDVLIQFGKPVLASDYFSTEQKPVRQQAELTKKIGKSLEKLTLHIGHKDYDTIRQKVLKRSASSPSVKTQLADFRRKKRWIAEYQKGNNPKKKNNIKVSRLSRILNFMALLLTLPFWAIGKAIAIVPQLIMFAVAKKTGDDHFLAAVKFTVGLFAYTLIGIGLAIYLLVSEFVIFWAVGKWCFLMFCLYFVMLWEERFRNFLANTRVVAS